MENWDNLNRMISQEREVYKNNVILAQKMIEFSMINNKQEIIKLLKEGATPNCFEDTLTPLICCVENDFYDLALFFLQAGASISYSPNKNNALWHALKIKSPRYVELFVERKCLLPLNEETNETPLIFATKGSDLESVRALLKHYMMTPEKVNEKDGHGNTALHYNVLRESMSPEDLEIGKLLIAAGADTMATNLEGKVPEDMASDFAARSMILANKLDKELVDEPENEMTDDNKDDMENKQPSQPKRLKI